MKKQLALLVLVGAAACQPPAARTTAAASRVPAAAAQAATAADTLPMATLSVYDLSPVLRTLPADPNDIVEPMNGFFGLGRYRIELVFTQVTRDLRQPTHYLIRGKSRYKGHVSPLAGVVELTRVQRQSEGSTGGIIRAAYTALGRFELREAAAHSHAPVGTFRGRVAIDWAVEKSGQVRQYTPSVKVSQADGIARIREYEPSTKTPTLGGGILYDGTWTSAAGQVKPAVWAADLLAYHGPQVLSNFAIGGRMLDVNPKYAKLGWNKFWENDEWWVESPKPSLNR